MLDIDKVHTTSLGVLRIRKGLEITWPIDVTEYCKNKLKNENCTIKQRGKNYYCYFDDGTVLTICSYNNCIITAKKI